MIVAALITMLLGPVDWLLALLPDYTPNTFGDGDAVNFVVQGMHALDNWVNVWALVGVIGLWATVEGVVVAARVVQWVYAKVPGKST